MFPPSRLINQRRVLGTIIVMVNVVLASWSYQNSNQQVDSPPIVIGEDSLSLESEIPIAKLVAGSDLIVRGKIVEITSSWNSDQTAITTISKLEPTYSILGNPSEPLTVFTDGGFVEGDIGMKSSNSPIFTLDEEVLLFLTAAEGAEGYNVSHGELGKYIATGMYMANTILRTTTKTEEIYESIEAELAATDQVSQLPTAWADYESDVPPIVYDGYDGQGFVYKNRKWGGTCPEVKYKININTAQAGGENGSVEEFRDAIISAADSWNAVGTSDFLLTYDGVTDATETGFNGSNEIMFAHEGTDSPTGLARFWFTADFIIVEADIWFNDDFNWDVTGSPKFTEVDLESVALHEFGHWLALGHDDSGSAIMYPTLTMGTTKRELHQNEKDGITFIYPRPEGSNCAQAELPTPTPSPTPVPPTPTPDPAATANLETNFLNGAPGSYFTLSGSNYTPSSVVALNINENPLTTIQVSEAGEFVAILNTVGATPGTYAISTTPSQNLNLAFAQSSAIDSKLLFAGFSLPHRAARSNSMLNGSGKAQAALSIVLDEDLAQRPKEVPIRTNGLSIVEFNLQPSGNGIYLPVIQN